MANFQRHVWMTQVYETEHVAPITVAVMIVVPAPILTLQDQQANTTTLPCVIIGPTTSQTCADATVTMQDLIAADASMATMEATAMKRWTVLDAQFLNLMKKSGLTTSILS